MKTQELPKRINAMRVSSYIVSEIVEYVAETNEKPISEVTLDEVLDWIDEQATEDLGSAYNKIIYQDENGEEISE